MQKLGEIKFATVDEQVIRVRVRYATAELREIRLEICPIGANYGKDELDLAISGWLGSLGKWLWHRLRDEGSFACARKMSFTVRVT
jgi:hypothetical protein